MKNNQEVLKSTKDYQQQKYDILLHLGPFWDMPSGLK